MPRLSRAQREAKEAQRTAVAAQLAADAQTAIGTSSKAPPPPPPLASALSTNQPVKITTSGTKGVTDEDEANATTEIRSPSSISERATGTRPSISRHDASSSAAPGSPPGVASDVSTSEESDGELDGDSQQQHQQARANISLVDEHADGDEDEETGDATLADGSPEVKCMWEDCGQVFTSLAPFINHLHDEHVGIHKARYSCEWSGCPRKGKGQTSRFALLSHLRSHTGEKPFTCPRPECDKSFTRSDALAKHMRVQHNINPVTTRGKAASTHLGMTGRSSRLRGDGDDEDWPEDGPGRGSADVLADELLELAEGESNGSLADVEQSLLMHGAKSPFFTYDNLFGTASRALAQLGGGATGTASSLANATIPDADLGIVRDTQPCTGLLLNDDVRDEEAIKREEKEMDRVLEQGRREWIRRERERAELRPDPELTANKRDQIDYLSDDDGDDSRNLKRTRRSSTRNAQRQAQSISDVANLKRLYVLEKAKHRFIQRENERMRAYLERLRTVEQREMLEKRNLLERTLETELGKDVGAIFSPPGTPVPTRK